MPLTYKEIAEIIRLIDASSLEEFTIDSGDVKLSVRRRGTGGESDRRPSTASDAAPALGNGAAAGPDPTAGATGPSPPASPHAPADGLVEVCSPMVGIFYRRPAPDAAPFVEVGDRVARGDPLCLVEVMKLFTTLYAETSGRVVEIAVADAGVVEYGQRLFLIEPD